MDFNVTGSGSAAKVQFDTTDQTSTTTGNRWDLFPDGITSAEGSIPTSDYMARAQFPRLFPNLFDGNANEETPETINPSETTFSQEYYTAFAEILDGIVDEHNLTEEQVQELIFSHMTGIPSADPTVEAALMALEGKLEEIAQSWDFPTQQDRENWKKNLNDVKGPFLEGIKKEYGANFEEALLAYARENNLSDEQTAQLRFLHFNPDPDQIGSDESDIADILKEIEANASAELESTWGSPKGYTPPVDNIDFNATIIVAYDNAFKATIQEQIDSGTLDISALAEELGLTEEGVISRLNYLHFNPEATFPGSEALAPAVANLENMALQSVRSDFGIVGDFTVEMGSFHYNAVFDGDFNFLFYNNLQNAGLSQDEIGEIMTMLANPLNSEITSHPIFLKTLGEIRAIYNLPSNWMPSIEGLAYLVNVSPHVGLAWNYASAVEEALNTATLLISSFPDSPEKVLLLNFLKIVSQALANLRRQIAVMQVMDAQLSRELSKVRMETAIYKIDLQEQKRKKAEEKARPKKSLRVFMKIMKSFGKVMEVIMNAIIIAAVFALAGPAAAILIAVLIVTMFIMKEAAPELVVKMYEGIANAFGDSKFGKFFGGLVCLFVSLFAGYSGLQAFFEHSGAIERFLVDVCGVSESAAMWANMILQLVVEIVLMIALAAVTGGAALTLVIAKISAFCSKVAITIVNAAVRALNAVSKIFKSAAKLATRLAAFSKELANSARTTASAAARVREAQEMLAFAKKTKDADLIKSAEQAIKATVENLEKSLKLYDRVYRLVARLENLGNITAATMRIDGALRQKDLYLELAELEEAIEGLKALLKMLKKLIELLTSGGDALGEWLVSLAEQMDKAWSNKSLTLSAIYEQQG